MPVDVSGLIHIIKKYGFEYFGIFYGKYRGRVVSNLDPEKLGRLKINVPQVSGKNIMESWAWPSGVIAGDDFGTYFIPPKGSLVWVTFENGDPNHPVWEGGHWARDQIPKAAKQASPNNRVLQSKNWTLEMNDTESAEKFKITDKKSGNSFEFDSTTGDLNLKIKGSENHTITKNLSTKITGNKSDDVTGNYDAKIIGNSTEKVTGNKSINCVGFSLTSTGISSMRFGSGQISLSPSEFLFQVSGHSFRINSAGVFIDGRKFSSHTHRGVRTGSSNTGGVV